MGARSRSHLIGVTAVVATGLALCVYGSYRKSRRKKELLKRSLSSGSSKKALIYHPSPPSDGEMCDFLDGDTVVLDEVGALEPSSGEIARVASGVGVSEAVAKKLLSDPLPEGWKACKLVELSHSEDEMVTGFDIHSVYYFNFNTGESLWDHPLVVKYKGEQDEKEKQRLKKMEMEKESNHKLQQEKIAKKRERMERQLSAVAKKPVSLEKMFAEDSEVVITAKVIMDAFDTNRDGELSKKEFTNGLRSVDPKSKVGKHLIDIFGINWRQKKEVTLLFKQIDIDGDGSLTLDELTRYVEKLDDAADAHRTIIARRMSSISDDTQERAIFDKYKNDAGYLGIENFEKMWKELGAGIGGNPFSDKQCKKWAAKSMKKLASMSDSDYDVEKGVTFEAFQTLIVAGPLFDIVTKRLDMD